MSQKIGMKESQLSRYLHGPDNITLKTMIDILAGLDMKLKFSCVPTQEEKIVLSGNSCSANSSDESYRFNLSCSISDTQYLKIPETLNETKLCNNTYQVPDNIEKEPS
jgi:transcriptional regulator with XRE-family HTH domain